MLWLLGELSEWCAFALSQIILYVKQEKGCPYPALATPQLSVRTTGALVPMNERSFHMRSLLVSMPWTHGNRYSELPKPIPWPDEWVVNMSSTQKSKEPFCRTYCVQSCGSMLLDCTCPIEPRNQYPDIWFMSLQPFSSTKVIVTGLPRKALTLNRQR